jgi:molecular chaperone GrpE
MASDSEPFDAVAAARELDEILAGSDETELETLHAKLAAAEARADRAEAEIEAASKRIGKASAKELEHRTRKILESFLPVLDDLGRGIDVARKHAESKDVVEGLELVRRSMLKQLGQFGVTRAPALGEVFDPQRHDALALVPVTDPAQHGRVIGVMRDGYQIGEETLRPAGVAVGKR